MTNPLCGPEGASAVYGPQKGATPEMVEALDRNLAHFAAIVERDLGVAIKDLPGSVPPAGWAGLVAFAAAGSSPASSSSSRPSIWPSGSRRRPVPDRRRGNRRSECLRQDGRRRRADWLARCGCPVLALAGSIGPGAEAVLEQGIDAYFSICPGPISLDQAIEQAGTLLERATEQAVQGVSSRRTPANVLSLTFDSSVRCAPEVNQSVIA